ncbi:hypothetical protein G7Z17_g1033 [Cylindrodendrum hubeiense]|uniref:Methyltransferase n=1 Tax=Cylindrodendrum hubeiense TaxID=595255 RepID=A0A9P5LLR6_9HYPO|nr:hypothetical protein G7Z17_g1033 [Cylindrodendrum hubeiense]
MSDNTDRAPPTGSPPALVSAETPTATATQTSALLPPQHWTETTEELPVYDDVDSALGDNLSSTASIASSILKYRTILGRTFHSEQGDAHYCDFADEFPGAEVIGTDISPIQPTWVPPNLQFQIDDCTREWTFTPESLDYVHIRFLSGCIADWTALFKQAYHSLKPGGIIETMEPSAYIESDDGTVEETSAMGQWGKIFIEGGQKIGRKFTVFQDNTQNTALEEAGFVDLHEHTYKSPIGSWPKDEKLREIGQYVQLTMESDFEGIIVFMTSVLGGWTKEDIQVYIAHLRREIRDKRKHGWFWQKIVWARKPE